MELQQTPPILSLPHQDRLYSSSSRPSPTVFPYSSQHFSSSPSSCNTSMHSVGRKPILTVCLLIRQHQSPQSEWENSESQFHFYTQKHPYLSRLCPFTTLVLCASHLCPICNCPIFSCTGVSVFLLTVVTASTFPRLWPWRQKVNVCASTLRWT